MTYLRRPHGPGKPSGLGSAQVLIKVLKRLGWLIRLTKCVGASVAVQGFKPFRLWARGWTSRRKRTPCLQLQCTASSIQLQHRDSLPAPSRPRCRCSPERPFVSRLARHRHHHPNPHSRLNSRGRLPVSGPEPSCAAPWRPASQGVKERRARPACPWRTRRAGGWSSERLPGPARKANYAGIRPGRCRVEELGILAELARVWRAHGLARGGASEAVDGERAQCSFSQRKREGSNR